MFSQSPRRGFFGRIAGFGIAGAAFGQPQSRPATAAVHLPDYALAQDYRSLKQSSYDRTGGNADRWTIDAGETKEVFRSDGPGVITHLWFTIDSPSPRHLKEIVLRMYWEGNEKPSVETPIGDFFGLNLGSYFVYQSAFLNCSSIRALNCYFAMPFRKSARITVENQGSARVRAFYSNIDYQLVPAVPDRALYFHAQYRQATPNTAVDAKVNLDGAKNYIYVESRGTGQLMGVTLGVLQNRDAWMGEGDDMIFIDDETKPAITGTGSEDYFNGAWDFGGRDGSIAFAHLYNGAPYIAAPETAGGRYCLYRWHADNPVTFRSYLKHTMEHGHANDRSDCFYSVAYWYQSEPYTRFPALAPAADRFPAPKA